MYAPASWAEKDVRGNLSEKTDTKGVKFFYRILISQISVSTIFPIYEN